MIWRVYQSAVVLFFIFGNIYWDWDWRKAGEAIRAGIAARLYAQL